MAGPLRPQHEHRPRCREARSREMKNTLFIFYLKTQRLRTWSLYPKPISTWEWRSCRANGIDAALYTCLNER